MSRMAEIDMMIRELLDTTMLSCQEIADQVDCPVDWVNGIVEKRWESLLANQEFQDGYEAYKEATGA